ncbi:uncharacterized protein LOC114276209 [Camellia sinensis]|uniref:uncharacterized protein LOC114276209 n=1 Tax=Camellia sinensis TaxID=4442 RepID=UPI001036D43C|nr:uncharacterized protein LOC114276209 [Camellia sinensis]
MAPIPYSLRFTINRQFVPHYHCSTKVTAIFPQNIITCSGDTTYDEDRNSKRRAILLGVGALALISCPASSLFAEAIKQEKLILGMLSPIDEFSNINSRNNQ